MDKEKIEEMRKAKEAMQKEREAEMEKIVTFSREKIVPFLKEKGKTIKESKMLLDVLAVAVQNSLFQVMREKKVGELGLKDKITKDYPNAETYLALLEIVSNESMMLGTEVLQWTSEKIKALLTEEEKNRNISELNLDF